MNTTSLGNDDDLSRFNLETNEAADLLHVKPQTILKRRSQTGSYFGITAQKGLNGRLLWPEDVLGQFLKAKSGDVS